MSWTLRDFAPGYTALGWRPDSSPLAMVYYALVEALIKFSAYIPIGIAAALVLPSAHSREREGLYLICGIVSFQIVGIAMQAKFFEYHYGATIPLLAFLAGIGWSKLWWTAQARGVVAILGFSLALLFAGLIAPVVHDLPGTPWQRTAQRVKFMLHAHSAAARERLDDAIAKAASFDLAADRDVAAWMKGQTGPNDSVLVWGFEPAIYWFAERKPASRFIYDVAQRSPWQQAKARQWFMDDLRKNKPVVVAVQHSDLFPGVTGHDTDSAADIDDFPEFAEWLRRGYSPAGYRYNFEYFRRRDQALRHACVGATHASPLLDPARVDARVAPRNYATRLLRAVKTKHAKRLSNKAQMAHQSLDAPSCLITDPQEDCGQAVAIEFACESHPVPPLVHMLLSAAKQLK